MKSAAEIKREMENIDIEDASAVTAFVGEYGSDERTSVKALVTRLEKAVSARKAEHERLKAMRAFEDKYPDHSLICGIDEVGRGPLAGPVMAGAVILPKDCEILFINDSKKLSEKKR